MNRITLSLGVLIFLTIGSIKGQFQSDTIKSETSEFRIYFIAHGTLYFDFNGTIVHVDPVGMYADYKTLPSADLILVTHHHRDHLDPAAISELKKEGTELIVNNSSFEQIKEGKVLKNYEIAQFKDIKIEAVAAYNIVHKRDNGEVFHPKGIGNGYVLTFDDKKIYIAGDTENIPEMKDLKDIDIAFLPMNLPYTMTPEMVSNAVSLFHPAILYPYHYGDTDVNRLLELFMDNKICEVRIRNMK